MGEDLKEIQFWAEFIAGGSMGEEKAVSNEKFVIRFKSGRFERKKTKDH
jgi:hypothetical protein